MTFGAQHSQVHAERAWKTSHGAMRTYDSHGALQPALSALTNPYCPRDKVVNPYATKREHDIEEARMRERRCTFDATRAIGIITTPDEANVTPPLSPVASPRHEHNRYNRNNRGEYTAMNDQYLRLNDYYAKINSLEY